MPSRTAGRAVVALALGALLGACQLTVGIDTTVDPAGRGTVALRMAMDEELLTTARSDVFEMRAFEMLFDELAARGWVVTRTQPDGGLEMRAERAFASIAEHRSAIAQLRGAVAKNPSHLITDELAFDLRLRTNTGLFQTRARLDGTLDTSKGVTLDPNLLSAVEDLVRFEVGVSLPGQATVNAGEASADGSRMVWKPGLGERVRFAASSQAMRLGPMFVALFVALTLVAAAIGSLVSRRRRDVRAAAAARRAPVVVLDERRRQPLPDADIVLTAKPIDVEALLGAPQEQAPARAGGDPSRRRP